MVRFLSKSFNFVKIVGDKVLIENISVGIGSTGKGFNSSAYDYKLFPIIAVDKNLGGIGATVAYSLEGLVDTGRGEFVGKFDSFNSGGRLIPEKLRLVKSRIEFLKEYEKNT